MAWTCKEGSPQFAMIDHASKQDQRRGCVVAQRSDSARGYPASFIPPYELIASHQHNYTTIICCLKEIIKHTYDGSRQQYHVSSAAGEQK